MRTINSLISFETSRDRKSSAIKIFTFSFFVTSSNTIYMYIYILEYHLVVIDFHILFIHLLTRNLVDFKNIYLLLF